MASWSSSPTATTARATAPAAVPYPLLPRHRRPRLRSRRRSSHRRWLQIVEALPPAANEAARAAVVATAVRHVLPAFISSLLPACPPSSRLHHGPHFLGQRARLMRLAACCGTAVSWQLPGGLRAALARPAAALCPTTSSSSPSSWRVRPEGLKPRVVVCCRCLCICADTSCVCAYVPDFCQRPQEPQGKEDSKDVLPFGVAGLLTRTESSTWSGAED